MRYRNMGVSLFLFINVVLVGCGSEPDDVTKLTQTENQPVSLDQMSDEQLQQQYISDVKNLEDEFANKEEKPENALRAAIAIQQLDSFREIERRNEVKKEKRLEPERIEKAQDEEQVRRENAQRAKETAAEQRRADLKHKRMMEIENRAARERQAEDIRLLEENRRAAQEEGRKRLESDAM